MRDSGYPDETEIYFSGLMSGALVMNSMAQDKFKDKLSADRLKDTIQNII